jgi:hypothetical protein
LRLEKILGQAARCLPPQLVGTPLHRPKYSLSSSNLAYACCRLSREISVCLGGMDKVSAGFVVSKGFGAANRLSGQKKRARKIQPNRRQLPLFSLKTP